MKPSRHHTRRLPGKQSGAVLVAFTLIVLVGASFLLVNQLNAKINSNVRTEQSIENLLIAKQALIAYAVAYPEVVAPDSTSDDKLLFGPGYLPCPDRHSEDHPDFGSPGSDGAVSASCAQSGGTTIGRFPSQLQKMSTGTLKDSSGEYLWYALSDNYRNNPKVDVMNSAVPGQITLNDNEGDIVAVIISPGKALNDQVRNEDTFNSVEHYLEGVDLVNRDLGSNFYRFTSGIVKDRNGNIISNDIVIPITRKELMSYVEKRVLNDVKVAINNYRGYSRVDIDEDNNFDDNDDGYVDLENMNFEYAFPWLSQYRNPASATPILSGTTTASGLSNQLVDTNRNFENDGISVGDLVQNMTDDTVGIVANVSSNTLTISPLAKGLNELVFDTGDSYQIPGFNSTSSTTQGHLPYHEENEAFTTAFSLDWRFTDNTDSALITSDNPIADSEHETALETSMFGGQTNRVEFTEDQAACVWISSYGDARCIGVDVEEEFLSGTATSNTTTNNQVITLEDANRNFYAAGVRTGDIVQNLSQVSELAVLQSQATAGSGVNLLVDSDLVDNFEDLRIEPYYFLVEKTGIDSDGQPVIETAIISDVQPNQLTLLESEQTSLTMNAGDSYTIRPVIQGIVSSISSADPDQLEAIEISGSSSSGLSFQPDDKYRIRVAATARAGTASQVFSFNNGTSSSHMVSDDTADLSTVKAGDIVEGDSGGLAVITMVGVGSGFSDWFVHSEMVGASSGRLNIGEGYRIHQNHIDKREFIVDVSITGGEHSIYSTETDADNGMRVRQVCMGYTDNNGEKCATQSMAVDIANNIEITVNEYNSDDDLLVTSTLTKPNGAEISGNMKLGNIRLDLVKDYDIPAWFVHNQWHHHVLVAYTDDLAPSEDTGCIQNINDGTFQNCLTVNTATQVQPGINSLVLFAGNSLDAVNQQRNPPITVTNSPPGLDDYFEGVNFDGDNLFESRKTSDDYNDSLLVLDIFRNE